MKLQTAHRRNAKIRLGLQGPSGSGKTMSALLLAYGLVGDWTKIALIDTENHSSELYSYLGEYQVLHLNAPYNPERYIEAIKVCEEADILVIIIDSLSHEWSGTGGILEVHGGMVGNSFSNWSKLTPRHNQLINSILQSKSHVVTTIRTKQDYVLSEKNGKIVPEKVGLAGIQRDGLDYEMTLMFDLDIKHYATTSKDRTGLFVGKSDFKISIDTGKLIQAWCESGISIKDIEEQIESSKDIETLKEIYESFPEFQTLLSNHFSRKKTFLQQLNNAHLLTFSKNGTINRA